MTDTRYSLRRGIAADAPALWAIRSDAVRCTCRGHYPDELLERWAASPLPESFPANIEREYVIVGVVGSRIAGFATLKASTAEVDAVFVAPGEGRRGLGRRLLVHIEDVAARKGLQRLGLNASLNAVPFYEACGYEAISEGVYTTGAGVQIACVRMEKAIETLTA
ncbi:MAG: GNAT family N-acetyltransferase [Proteobacteria bacterium]|nr:GNAT family N-acetyltransferase [Pseudomonadota bacterium]